jgi:hypothetical protein
MLRDGRGSEVLDPEHAEQDDGLVPARGAR